MTLVSWQRRCNWIRKEILPSQDDTLLKKRDRPLNLSIWQLIEISAKYLRKFMFFVSYLRIKIYCLKLSLFYDSLIHSIDGISWRFEIQPIAIYSTKVGNFYCWYFNTSHIFLTGHSKHSLSLFSTLHFEYWKLLSSIYWQL